MACQQDWNATPQNFRAWIQHRVGLAVQQVLWVVGIAAGRVTGMQDPLWLSEVRAPEHWVATHI